MSAEPPTRARNVVEGDTPAEMIKVRPPARSHRWAPRLTLGRSRAAHTPSSSSACVRRRMARELMGCSPCKEASKESMACMNRNDFDRTACQDAFQAYRDCKKAWVRAPLLRLERGCL
jgi:hypothetical protein